MQSAHPPANTVAQWPGSTLVGPMRAVLTTDEIRKFRETFGQIALQAYLDEGFDGISMRKVARRMEVSQATAYRYFEDKEEMLSVIRAAAVERFVTALKTARGTLRSRLAARAIGKAYLDFALTNPELYRLIFDVHQPELGRFRELAFETARARDIMTSYVAEMAADGLVTGESESLAVILWSGAHGLVMNYLTGLIASQQELVSLHETMMRRLLPPLTAH